MRKATTRNLLVQIQVPHSRRCIYPERFTFECWYVLERFTRQCGWYRSSTMAERLVHRSKFDLRNSKFISRNSKFISRNSKSISRKSKCISRNCKLYWQGHLIDSIIWVLVSVIHNILGYAYTLISVLYL